MLNNEEWTLEASCVAPDLPFTDFHSSKEEDQERAKALCAACPVRKMCIQYALDNKERHGRWGVSELELRRVQAINAKGEPHTSKSGKIRCANCGPRSTKNLVIIERKRTRTHIQCSVCELRWWARKSISEKTLNF